MIDSERRIVASHTHPQHAGSGDALGIITRRQGDSGQCRQHFLAARIGPTGIAQVRVHEPGIPRDEIRLVENRRGQI